MRNPKWHRDEIILALDLYFAEDRGPIDHKDPKIIALSKTLNELPLYTNRPDEEKFRNPNGVSLKLSNFLAIDPHYKGKGMTGGSKLDEKVFHEFSANLEHLKTIAAEIRKISTNPAIKAQILTIEDDEQTDSDSVVEGAALYKWHKVIERDRKIVKNKKKQALGAHGELSCEVCAFNFKNTYGPLGDGFIECHHRVPLARLKIATETTLEDLALVCSNCHRMLHKKINAALSVEELKAIIQSTG